MSTEDVTFAYPREFLRILDEEMTSVREALASPPEAAANLETIDELSYLFDMMISLGRRAKALLELPADAPERADIAEGIPRAWKGVYGRDLDAMWKRRLLFAVDYVSRVIMVHVPSGKRIPPTGVDAGNFVLQVIFPAMEKAFAPHVLELGACVEAWRDQKGGASPGKFTLVADLYTVVTGEKVEAGSLEKMFKRMRQDPTWELHEKVMEVGARSSNVRPDVRLELAS